MLVLKANLYLYIYMIFRGLNIIGSFCTTYSRYLQPYSLTIQQSAAMPTLKLKSQKQLLQNWWSNSPFEVNDKMLVPLFQFNNNQYDGKAVQIPTQIFNHPLRRDLIYRLYTYRNRLNRYRTKMTRTRGTTAGSGKKMRPQKKGGVARMGDKRAPHLRKGGKAHGAKPKVYSFPLNAKIKLKALYSLLSAKLSQGKIKIVDSENLQQPKTKVLSKILNTHVNDDRALFCIITSQQADQNFKLAQQNIKRCIWHNSFDLDVHSLFIADKIFITVKGLEELIQNLRKTAYIVYRQPYQPEIKQQEEGLQQEVKYDPENPYEFKFRILAEYLQLYEKVRNEKPDLLEEEMSRIRKVQCAKN